MTLQDHQPVLDPQLSNSHYNPPPPPSSSSVDKPEHNRGNASVYPDATSQTYPYYFPSPQQSHNPQQLRTASATTHDSGQPSPHDVAYQTTADVSPDAGDVDPNNPDDPRRPRACEACRGLKVRCDQDPSRPDLPCKRCAKAGRECVVTQPSRKRQKKADSRVAELEKKLDALTAALQNQRQAPSLVPPPAASDATGRSSADVPLAPPAKRRRTEDTDYPPSSYTTAPVLTDPREHLDAKSNSFLREHDVLRMLHKSTPQEFVERIESLVHPDLAQVIFDRYRDELCPHMPAVILPPTVAAATTFRQKPILYVCVLSVACHGLVTPEVALALTREAVGAIADTAVRNGAKSLELIQAMQVVALWYKPPENAEQANFNQIIHMAAVMALDIGLGKRFNPARAKRGFGGPNAKYVPGPLKMLPQDSDTLEARRAWLTCYYLCASASMVLRRPNLVRWSNYMKECIDVLETHVDALPSDKLLAQHIKIQHINEEIGLQFLMDDSSANISITDPKVTYALNILENQLKSWKENIPPELRTPGLLFFEHVTSLYLHEIALHFNHNIEDFRIPFTEESLKSVNNSTDTLTIGQVAALEACLKAAHGLLDTMLSFDRQVTSQLPLLLYFIRCVYAIVILIKLHVAVTAPNSEIGKVMTVEHLQVEVYIESLCGLFETSVVDSKLHRYHPKMLMILTLLRDWFVKHKEGLAPATAQNRTAQRDQARYNQTPLHLLSQVATGNSQPSSPDWTFNTPTAVDYSQRPQGYTPNQLSRSGSTTSGERKSQQPGYPTPGSYEPSHQGQMPQGMPDPLNADWGWGSGFEQALDIALSSVDGLQGAGLDSWFLGDSMAPFGLNTDISGQAQP